MTMTDLFQFPVSAFLGVAFALLTWLLHKQAGSRKAVRALAGWKAGAISMSVVAVMMAIEGTWAVKLHEWPLFWIAVLMLQLCLGLTILSKIDSPAGSKRNTTFIITHMGMYLMAWASFWGSPDVTKAQLPVGYTDETSLAFDSEGMTVPLPFALKLEDFIIDRYDDGSSPKQYTSVLSARDILNPSKSDVTLRTSVNHPCRHKGYRLYQSGYDTAYGQYSVILIVRDPWLPLVYLGMALLAIGSSMMLAGRWKRKVLIPAVIVLAVVFSFATVAKISFGTLPPALRSIWFVPHLIVYMIAYSAMAVSVVLAIVAAVRPSASATAGELSDSLLRTASVLLLAGMLCGCVWAKQAWGDYWAWDPKENWAGVTWLLTLVHIHLAPMKNSRTKLLLAVLLLCFLSIQVTWYGVNYLPSASVSMHTYNR